MARKLGPRRGGEPGLPGGGGTPRGKEDSETALPVTASTGTCGCVQKPLGSDPPSSLPGSDTNGARPRHKHQPLPPNTGFQLRADQMGRQHVESDPVMA